MKTENVHEGCISRKELAEKVEGMRRTDDTQMSHDHVYDEALDDLLTHLRGEELCIFHKDKNCCAYDVKQRSGIQTNYVDSRTPDEKVNEPDSVITTAQSFQGAAFVGGFPEELLAGNSPQEETGCCTVCWSNRWKNCRFPNCPACHKPRTEGYALCPVCKLPPHNPECEPRTELDIDESSGVAFLKPRTEETEKGKCCAKCQDSNEYGVPSVPCEHCSCHSEKEGASFSGRLGGDAPCADCGARDNVRWFVENVFWNAVMDDDDRVNDKTNEERGKILCIPCFVRRAQSVYDVAKWRLTPEWDWKPRPKETTTPQSREQSTGGKCPYYSPDCPKCEKTNQ